MKRALVLAAAVAIAAAACSGGGSDGKSGGGTTSTTSSRASVDRPAGPAADLSQEITGGNGPFVAAATPETMDGTGYVQHEYVASGTATSYKADGELPGDGRWKLSPDTQAAYRTRVVVRRPADPKKFDGNVVVEWLNVSGGLDADPDYAAFHEELIRKGTAWVGVSAQLIGVEGGPVLVSAPGADNLAGKGLKALDPARYSSLQHPGDGYSYDMFTQIARAIRAGGTPMGGMKPKHVVAAGESQSAFAMVTYYDGVQPLTKAFDGFFVHSRGAVALPLVGPGKSADIAGSITGKPTIFRTDQDAPVLDLQTESDVTGVLNSLAARQPDTDHFRLWEVAGTAHADAHLLGSIAALLDCGVAINDGPQHVVAKAALHALLQWVDDGRLPPKAPRFEITSGAKKEIARDEDGIAKGAIRIPPVDVPVDALTGNPGPSPSTICLLLGSTTPLPDARIAQLYSSRADYQKKFDAAVDKAIASGFVLAADKQALEAYAKPSRVKG